MSSADKKKILQSIKNEISRYMSLEEKLSALGEDRSKNVSGLKDPNLLVEEVETIKQEMSLCIKNVVSMVEQASLVDDMPKDIQSVYLQLKKEAKV